MKTLKLFLIALLVPMLAGCEKDNFSNEFTGNSSGCSNFCVYKMSTKSNKGIAVIGDRDALNLTTAKQTFDLSATNSLCVEVVEITKFVSGYYCDDVGGDEIKQLWNSVSGKVTIQITQDIDENSPHYEKIYKIRVEIRNVVLQNEAGKQKNISHLDFGEVTVGWLPG